MARCKFIFLLFIAMLLLSYSTAIADEALPGNTVTVKGEIHKRLFTASQAKFDTIANTLEIRQGEDFYPDLGILILLSKPKAASWENVELHITPDARGARPDVYKKWKDNNVQHKLMYGSNYGLNLSLGEIHDGKIHGTINLHLPDPQGSHVQGDFDAIVEGKAPGYETSPVIVKKGSDSQAAAAIDKKQTTDNRFVWTIAALSGLAGFAIAIIIIAIINRKN